MPRKDKQVSLNNVTIDAVAAEGKALAHVDGLVLFVQFAVPGDVVNVKAVKKHNYMEGYITELVKPSPDRLEPFCKHFGTCGGCKWQPLPYELQLKAKTQQVYDQLVRIGHLDVPEIPLALGSDKTSFYRNKLEFSFSNRRWFDFGENTEGLSEAQKCGLGFHVGRFFDKVLDIEKCWLQPEPSNAIRLFIKQLAIKNGWSFYDIRNNTGLLRNMFVRCNNKGEFMVIICFGEENKKARTTLLDALVKEFPQIVSLYYVVNLKKNDSISDQDCALYYGEDAIYEQMENLRFKIGPKSFYQTNSDQAYKLYSVVREFAGLTGSQTVYDLYTGTGTIAQFVSAKAAKVIGIEYVPEAIEDAWTNVRLNGITNCDFYAGDMKNILTNDFVAAHGHPDVVILDPPRAGIHPDVADVILKAAPEKIVYVSCNPASQARDLAIMQQDYKIVRVQPVDMFPHTHHVENVCELIRK
ncbi:MAG: 23S rRNA (uracil(1939)-C(5))-methyltransferase RlmD [Bacteroidales bacterium]|nr:23S rRNA (uracil(1939)-C(5))-methyltransferase RlmD [Bacteroidales bacterium]